MFDVEHFVLICVAIILYPYVIYPLLVAFLAWLRPRPVQRQGAGSSFGNAGVKTPTAVSFIMAAHNEELRIEGRLRELITLLEVRDQDDEIIVVTDGSTDGTAEVVRAYTSGKYVRLVELPRHAGKAVALNHGAAAARNDFLVFADVRQTWAPDALARLLENFADPSVGAVSGELVVMSAAGPIAGVGLYWQFEKWLRCQESAVGSQVGVTGAISACRRELFAPVPPGTLLDDVYWPVCVAMRGYRVVHDRRAVAYDRLPERTADEFRRKVRTLAGNFQLVAGWPLLLSPWDNPIWIQLLSHKLARLLVPWALLALPVACVMVESPTTDLFLALQGACYTLALVGLLTGRGGKAAAAAASFIVLNAAAWVAFWVWATGRAGQSWTRVAYLPAMIDLSQETTQVEATPTEGVRLNT